jgi:hypothetical protein
MKSTKEILRLWSHITDLVHGSPYTTDELRDHASAVRVMLKSNDEPTQRKALREIISMCHPKHLGDNQIPEIDWKQWNTLLSEMKLRAEEIEARTTEP